MKLLQGLSKHIRSLPGIGRDQMQSFVDLGKLNPSGKDLGHGLEVGRFRYDAVIDIERCPARIAPLLLAGVMVWLGENDPDREELELDDPDVDVTLEGEQHVFVQITVVFDEALTIIEDPDGLISYDDKTWTVADVPVDVAEELDKLEST